MTVMEVAMADLRVTTEPTVLVTRFLGSCVAIALYDGSNRVGGLAHVMLPSSISRRPGERPGKFADTAVPSMLDGMESIGADRCEIVAKVAGGARMFKRVDPDKVLNMGQKNVEASLSALERAGIAVSAMDVGGGHGRTVELKTTDGTVRVCTFPEGDRTI